MPIARTLLARAALCAAALGSLALPLPAAAQPPTEFPVAVETLGDDALRERLTRHVLFADADNNDRWRLEFKADGYYYLDIQPGGRRSSGQWEASGGRVCMQARSEPRRCPEVRVRGDIVFIRFGPALGNEVLLFLAE